MIVYLVEMLPVRKDTATIKPLRYGSSSACTAVPSLPGVTWPSRLTTPWKRNIQVFDGTFSDQPPAYASVEVALGRDDDITAVIGLAWDGRRVRVWRGRPGLDLADMELLFDGEAQNVEATKTGFQVNLRGPGYALSGNALTELYTGGGDALGTPDLANVVKPMLLGDAINITPRYVDKARGIFQYHGYGAANGIAGVFDGGSALLYDGRNFGTYAELKAAAVAPGYYAQCTSLGMGRHGGTPIDNLTIDAAGAAFIPAGGAFIGHILRYLARERGKVAVDEATLDWFNTNLKHPQDNYITDQISLEAICRDMMLKLGGYTCFTAGGKFSAGLVRRGNAASLSLGRQNIAGLNVKATAAPYYRRRMGYQRSWTVQSYSQLRTPAEIKPRGAYAAGTSYGYYDLVSYNGSSWLHVGTDPTTGVAPVEGGVWTLFAKNTSKTSELIDDAGLGLTATWGSVSGVGRPTDFADVTAVNTAQYVKDQGWAATAPRDQADNKYVPVGQNALVNSNFARGTFAFRLGGELPVARFDDQFAEYTGRIKTLCLQLVNSGAGKSKDVSSLSPWYSPDVIGDMRKYCVPVKLGDRIAARAMVTTHRCNATLFILTFDRNGALVEAPGTGTGFTRDGGYQGENLGEMSVIHDVANPNSAYACWMLRATATTEQDPYMFFGQPWLGKLNPGQTSIPPYMPGPADYAADRTNDNTAAYVNNQGALAVLSSLAFGSAFLTGFAALAGLQYVKLGANDLRGAGLLTENGFGTSDNALVTSQGTAAYLANQGALATLSALSLGSQYLSGFGSLAGTDRVKLGSGGGMVDENNSYWLTSGIVVTSVGTAQYVANQGALATLSTVNADDGRYITLPGRLQGSPQHGAGFLQAGAVAFSAGNTIEDLRPGERGSNITENRTSAYFNNQGVLATSSFVQFGSSTTVRREDGSTVTDTQVVTSIGTALYIANQGSLATKSRVGGGDFDVFYGPNGGRMELNGSGIKIYAANGRLGGQFLI